MAIDPTDPDVVLVPGFMQGARSWDAVLERIGRRYSARAIEHAAHDLNGRLAEIEAAAPRGAALVGYSLGGRLALHAGLRAAGDRGRYGALITLGASPGIENPSERAERRAADEALAAWIESSPIEDVVARWEDNPALGGQPPQLVAGQRADRLARDPADLAALLRSAGQGAMEPAWDQLEGLELPLLALAGERDHRYVEAATRMGVMAAAGRARFIEDAGHAAHLERPEAFSAALLDFLDQHLGQRRLVDGYA